MTLRLCSTASIFKRNDSVTRTIQVVKTLSLSRKIPLNECAIRIRVFGLGAPVFGAG